MKTEKTTKTKTEKTVKVKKPKLDFLEFDLTAAELATLLGCSVNNVAELTKTGTLEKNPDGRYNARDNISRYVKILRERKQGTNLSELQLENIALKNEKIKAQLRSWRMQRDRECGLAIIQALRTAMQRLKADIGATTPAISEAIDGLIKAIESIDIDSISYIVVGENEEDED